MNIKNLDQLIIFNVIYGTRSISHAAKQLDMNQPTISNALARLRKQMGDPLFVRSGREMTPTARAKEMIGPVRRAIAEIESLDQKVNNFDLDHLVSDQEIFSIFDQGYRVEKLPEEEQQKTVLYLQQKHQNILQYQIIR